MSPLAWRQSAANATRRPLIAHVVYRFDVGGLENGVVNLVNRLPPDRYDHAIVALTDVTDFRLRIERERTTFHALGKPPGHGLAIYRDLYRLFRTLEPAIVHTRNLAASEAHVPAAVAGVPVRVHGEHGWDVHDADGGRRAHRWQRRALRPFVHRWVALSGEIRGFLEDRIGLPPAAIARICNGVDVERFAPRVGARVGPIAERFPGEVERPFVIGTVGRLSPVKHQRLLVDAFARAVALVGGRVPGRGAALRLVVVGDGPDRAALTRQVEAAGLADRVWITGSRDDVPALMRGFDCFALPSLAEGISNTLLEAMACGLPVVATRVGGNAELVDDGAVGTLVPSDDADAMAEALARFALDPVGAARAGRAARDRVVARFSIDAMVDAYAAMYDELLAARSSVSRRLASAAQPAVRGSAVR